MSRNSGRGIAVELAQCASFMRAFVPTVLFVLACLPGVLAGNARASEAVVYMAPSGSDSADGSSTESAVRTLERAFAVVASLSNSEVQRIRISVAAGTYVGQSVVTPGLPNGTPLLISPGDPGGARPVFDGGGNGETWFVLKNATGKRTNIRITGLLITNYRTAISMNGNRNSTRLSNGGNEIRDNVFSNIGQIANPSAGPSTAVIRLVNSDDNFIAKNEFSNFRNRQKCGLLHALYVAHDSTGNTISDNIFRNACGDAIRFRDGSGNNKVERNVFEDTWARNPVSDWYCDITRRSDCTKKSGECPSMGNVLSSNRVVSRKRPPPEIFAAYGEDVYELCPGKPGDRRVVIQ